jgi:hypothetical protein
MTSIGQKIVYGGIEHGTGSIIENVEALRNWPVRAFRLRYPAIPQSDFATAVCGHPVSRSATISRLTSLRPKAIPQVGTTSTGWIRSGKRKGYGKESLCLMKAHNLSVDASLKNTTAFSQI